VMPSPATQREAVSDTEVPAVHIGLVEIKIVPPVPPSINPPRSARASSSPVVLSRGFTTSFGLKQG
jgi:hypothetical protein